MIRWGFPPPPNLWHGAGHQCAQSEIARLGRAELPGQNDYGGGLPSELAVLEIFDHGLKWLSADMNGTGEGMIDRHDHKETHEYDD
jgi:hypothetical protein